MAANKKRTSFVWPAVALCMAAVLFLAFSLPLWPAGTPDDAGSEIRDGAEITLPDGQSGGTLLDRNRSSSLPLAGGSAVTITSETPFTHLYLVWDTPPAGWQATQNGTPAEAEVLPGILHQLVTLPAPTGSLTLKLGEGEHKLCDIYLFEDGPLPQWVQRWTAGEGHADLLCLPTHADDEHLFFGGILPTYAGERGLEVQVVYMTNHWGEPYRPHELLDGLWTVGVTRYPVIGPFPDLFASKESVASATELFGHDEVLGFQVEMLRRFTPHVVVGHDLNGEYGHGAHILNAQTLVEALDLSNDPDAHPESADAYGPWEVKKAYLHLYPENELVMDWDLPLDAFGGATAYEMAVAGFAKHTSQQEYFSVQQSGSWEDCRRFGLIHTTAGPDVAKNDLFENIDLAPEPEPDASVPVVSAFSEAPVSSAPEPDITSSAAQPVQSSRPRWLPYVIVVAGVGLVAFAVIDERRKRKK